MTFVQNVDTHLALECNTAQLKLDAECFFIDGFEQTRAKQTMNFNRRTDNVFRELVVQATHPFDMQ